jgi:hypothetical protein
MITADSLLRYKFNSLATGLRPSAVRQVEAADQYAVDRRLRPLTPFTLKVAIFIDWDR